MFYFLTAVGIMALLYFLGLGFTLFLIPRGEAGHWIVAPWVGYCYISVVSWQLYRLGLSINQLAATLLLIPPLICLWLGARRSFTAKLDPKKLRLFLMIFLVLAAGFAILSIPA